MQLSSLSELYATEGNYIVYRETLKTTKSTCTPYIGLYLRDLMYIEDGNPDNYDDNSINFKKRSLLGGILLEIKRFQARSHSISINEEIMRVIATYPRISEGESYQLSLRIEPRDPHSVIESLLTEEQKLTSKLENLRAQLAQAKLDFQVEKEKNQELRTQAGTGWQKPTITPSKERPQRRFLFSRV